MEAIGTLCRWLLGCKGTDNNRPDQIKFDLFCKTVCCVMCLRSLAWMCLEG